MTPELQHSIEIVTLATLQNQPAKEMTLKELTEIVKTQLRTNERTVRLVIIRMEKENQLVRILPPQPTMSPVIRLVSNTDKATVPTSAPASNIEVNTPSTDAVTVTPKSADDGSKLPTEQDDLNLLAAIVRRRRIVELACDGREMKITYEVVRTRNIRY